MTQHDSVILSMIHLLLRLATIPSSTGTSY